MGRVLCGLPVDALERPRPELNESGDKGDGATVPAIG